jgi:hypothetical protein
MRILGAAMPDEKVFRTRLLNELYEETKEMVDEDMKKLLNVIENGIETAEKLIFVKANYPIAELAGDELVALDYC